MMASDNRTSEITGIVVDSVLKEKDPHVVEVGELTVSARARELVAELDSELPTGRWELWAWYGYYFANNSAGTLSYAPLIFQSILSQVGHDGNDPSQDCSNSLDPCVVKFGSRTMNIDTVTLTCNGIIFAFNGFLLLLLGPMGDYGRWKRWILLACTLICWTTQFAFLGLKNGGQYKAAIVIYILTTVSYNLCQGFWQPSLPLLARNTPAARETRQVFVRGEISEDEYVHCQVLQRNKLSNISFAAMSIGYTIVLIIAIGAAFGLHADASTANNTHAAVVIVGIATGFWVLLGSPWFFLEKKRSQPLPPGQTYFSVGLKAYWQLLRHCRKLGQTWLYLCGYFMLADGYATSNQLVGLCQNSIVSYNTIISTELYIVAGISNVVGIAILWAVQRYWRISTKPMLMCICGFLLVVPVWGCIGIGTDNFGFHKAWEIWAWNVYDCAAIAPFYAFTATMLADIIPKGREVTFFSLWALFGKSTAWIGPIISGVIIDHTGSTWKGFPFSLGLSVAGFALIALVNVPKARGQCAIWAENDPTLSKDKRETS
ncbi:autophagy protein [Grosmannia clavigera kw1407]|uniref:Autophagy-related protein n=1 Tax=Grosmannia clavigera (strain kw1407 / UAMH 11150) TaxID=655863 RepID=F0X9X6_GROCL|nr:autophagy protein [Grosmannia clavigera kw1407]EFX05301.1 autophagy protein [Grosmannia clavigera kw1407]